MRCPRCGSSKLNKKGERSGKQRYRCMDCKANFCEGVKYVSAEKHEKPLEKTCLYCGSSNVIRDGKLIGGAQRYKCKSCGKGFSDATVIKEPTPDRFCPYCGSKLALSGHSKLGNRRYYCSSCKRSCSEDNEGTIHKRNRYTEIEGVTCPSCSSHDIRLDGYRDDRKRYRCKSCGKSFTEEPQVRKLTTEEKYEITKSVFRGLSISKVASKFNVCKGTVRGLVKDLYKQEKLTLEKRKMIYYYGCLLNVPIDYLAEYVPCSERACREFINEYKGKKCEKKNLKLALQKKIKNY